MFASVAATPLISPSAFLLPVPSGDPPQSAPALGLHWTAYLPAEKKKMASFLIWLVVALPLRPHVGFLVTNPAWVEVKADGWIWASSFSKMTAGPTQVLEPPLGCSSSPGSTPTR